MKRLTAALLAAIFLSIGTLIMPTYAQTPSVQAPAGQQWAPTFDDEFNGAGIDPALWSTALQLGNRLHGKMPAEKQYYADASVYTAGGYLYLQADKSSNVAATGGRPYTSGCVQTYGKFSQQYGLFEARMKLPPGAGYHPAFWLKTALRWPPEIDSVESEGNPNKPFFSNHWATPTGPAYWSSGCTIANATTGFHTYAVQWTPTSITWYVDGAKKASTNAHVPQEPLYLILDLTVDGQPPDAMNSATPMPAAMIVDWVRVWK